jgi:LysR family nitrogen assimilation transcriptional regulator
MELRQLRYFVSIVDHGSLSRAALVLHVAQPALTQQLRQLEEELGAQLLHRSAHGVLSTDAGKIFYEHAQAILKQVADARSAVTQSTTRPSGSVTLGLPHSISGALALPLLTAARATYPEITLQLTEEISGSLTEQLKSGRLNLAVLFDDGQLGGFEATPLVEEDLMYICRAASNWVPQAASITLGAGPGQPLILPAQQHGVRPLIEQVAAAPGWPCQHHRNQFDRDPEVGPAGRHGRDPAAAGAAARRDRSGRSAVPVHSPPIRRRVTLCASRNIPLTNAAAAISRLVRGVTEMLCANGQWPGARLRE